MDGDMRDESLKLSFLFNVGCFTNKIDVPEKVKSHYNHLGMTIAEWCNLGVQKSFGNKLVSCQFCCVQRNADNTSYKIIPTIRPGASMRRTISKAKNKKRLSTIQKKLLLRMHSGNTLVVTCLVCHKNTKLLYNKKEQNGAEKKQKEVKTKIKKKVQGGTPFKNPMPSSSDRVAPTPSLATSFPETSDCEIVSPLYDVSHSLIPKKIKPISVTEDFIPLNGNSAKPRVKAPRQENLFVNPFALKKSNESAKNVKNKKKLSALQLLMEKEQKTNHSNSPRLKDFLIVL